MTCPSDEVVSATKVNCEVELPYWVEVNVVLLVLLPLMVEDVEEGREVAEERVPVLVKVELSLVSVVGMVGVSVGGSVVVVALPVVVVVDSVSVVAV